MPPEILAGEAAVCVHNLLVLAAVVYVYQVNTRMNGWAEDVSPQVEWVALNWYMLPNVAQGAQYVFSTQDLKQQRVRQIIRQRAGDTRGPPIFNKLIMPAPIYKAHCAGGQALWFY